MQRLFRRLQKLREDSGLSYDEAEVQLVLGPGWIRKFESGDIEPSLGTLAALVHAYGSDLAEFFTGFDLGDTNITIDRHLSAVEVGEDLQLHFPMGPFAAEVMVSGASLAELNQVLLDLRNELAVGRKREGIVSCFLKATGSWPHANPSDLWYFLVSHAYQDIYNHPASEGARDWAQSWKRAGGWAFEAVLLEHYNTHLQGLGIQLVMPEHERKVRLLREMGVFDVAGAQKADVIVVGTRKGKQEAFGVVHVKASFAERRTDDVPLSQQLIAKGFASPLVTMDCKAKPKEHPYNGGELGPIQTDKVSASAKRLDIERDRKFDACFVYNTNTLPTPTDQAAAARIYVCDFGDPDDSFSRYLLRKWNERQGIL